MQFINFKQFKLIVLVQLTSLILGFSFLLWASEESKPSHHLETYQLLEGSCDRVLRDNPFRTVRIGETYYLLEKDPVEGFYLLKRWQFDDNGQKVVMRSREVPNDNRVFGIHSGTEIGELAIEVIYKQLQIESGQHAMVYLDVNDLGAVNYFLGGDEDGDTYLYALGAAIRNNMRDADHLFRIGGDEIVLILRNINSNSLMASLHRIAEKLAANAELGEVFQRQKEHNKSVIEQLILDKYPQNAHTYFDLLNTNRVANETEFLNQFPQNIIDDEELRSGLKSYFSVDRMKPSISFGSTFIYGLDTFQEAKLRAEEQAKDAKLAFKVSNGQSIDKYKSAILSSEERRELEAMRLEYPEIRPPAQRPQ